MAAHDLDKKDLDTFREFAPSVHNPNLRYPPILFRGTIKTTTRERQVANGLKGRIVSTIDKLKKLKVKAPGARARKAPPAPPGENDVKFTDQLKQLELKVLRNGRQIEAMMAGKIHAAGGRITKDHPDLSNVKRKKAVTSEPATQAARSASRFRRTRKPPRSGETTKVTAIRDTWPPP